MSTPANVLHDSPPRAESSAFSRISPVQLFSWSILRELWDHRALYVAPGLVAGLVLLGFFFGPFGLKNLHYLGSPEGTRDGFALTVPYELASGLIMATALLVSIFYSVDALYAERRDRSILFWKSLPVSDLTTVLAKASIPLFILPLVAFALTVTTHLLMALVSSVVLLRFGEPVAPLWSQLALPHQWLWMAEHLLTTALWYAPFYAWLLLVSAWATRAPLLLAFLPPLALSALEVIVFHTSYLGHALMERLAHGNVTATETTNTTLADPRFSVPLRFNVPLLSSLNMPELWLGLLVAALFFAGAVQSRRYKGVL